MKQAMINYIQTDKSDEVYTPDYAVFPILAFLKDDSKILCPFDTKESSFVRILKQASHSVIFSHISGGGAENNKDFFDYTKNELQELKIDYIISNPPYSIKDKVLEKLYELDIPFAMLLPLTTLEGVYRNKLFSKNGIEVLIFDKRINFLSQKKNNWFNTSFFCWKILPKQLIFKQLEKD